MMTELHIEEMEQISGGVLPIVALGMIGKGLANGFAIGVAVGSIAALAEL